MIILTEAEAAAVAPILAEYSRKTLNNGHNLRDDVQGALAKIFRAYQQVSNEKLAQAWPRRFDGIDHLMRQAPERSGRQVLHTAGK